MGVGVFRVDPRDLLEALAGLLELSLLGQGGPQELMGLGVVGAVPQGARTGPRYRGRRRPKRPGRPPGPAISGPLAPLPDR